MQKCEDLVPGEVLNAMREEWPLFKADLYGDPLLCVKFSRRLMCAIRHLPLRLSLKTTNDTDKAIEAGARKDPTLFVNNNLFIEGLVTAERITVEFTKLLKQTNS
ncbi:MAG: hypothetical protein RBR54_04860 [Sulfurimonas sp.]|jgi:hypothetical protein|nr:hypothetical protein [Sulfurimonas sp.]